MQLLALVVYRDSGERREVRFIPGRLNIVTGESATGKSALLDMVEYCLGRDTIMMPVGPITATVVWYAALLQLPGGGRAFVARPAPRVGRASTQQAMLEFGADLEVLNFASLVVNTGTDAVREQLGRRLGIEENLSDPGAFALRSRLEAHLAHAVLLCLQRQDEIANRNFLFHRQGEPGMEQALRDTIPYFLGAVARDQALKRARLQDARRELNRLLVAVSSAEAAARNVEGALRSLVAEAQAVGLMGPLEADDRGVVIAALESVIQGTAPADSQPGADRDGRLDLERQRRSLRDQLHVVSSERSLLLETQGEEDGYRSAVSAQVDRLLSLDLLPSSDETADSSTSQCPLCLSELGSPDPSVDDLHDTLDVLRRQLLGVEAARPARRLALVQLDTRSADLRDQLRVVETALRALTQGDEAVDLGADADRREFTRGRISAILGTVHRGDDGELARLVRDVAVSRRRVAALEAELDDGEATMLLDSRLLELSGEMTTQAQQLSLEHSGAMRLDLSRLTVITETDQGPAPLWRVGSAENWIGAHLTTHLALHKFFVTRNRPVPRFLMLDQPTQAFYPSEIEQRDGVPIADTDREAVRRIFRLLFEVTSELEPNLQVIVCDHANLPEEWFQDSVVHNWRDGEKLIPQTWLSADVSDESESDEP